MFKCVLKPSLSVCTTLVPCVFSSGSGSEQNEGCAVRTLYFLFFFNLNGFFSLQSWTKVLLCWWAENAEQRVQERSMGELQRGCRSWCCWSPEGSAEIRAKKGAENWDTTNTTNTNTTTDTTATLPTGDLLWLFSLLRLYHHHSSHRPDMVI